METYKNYNGDFCWGSSACIRKIAQFVRVVGNQIMNKNGKIA